MGKRVFDVFIQGEEVAYHFDIFERAGAGRTAYILNQSVGITDGTLTIVLRKSCKWPRLVAFQFIPHDGAFQESSRARTTIPDTINDIDVTTTEDTKATLTTIFSDSDGRNL